jgi:hypothetical protein
LQLLILLLFPWLLLSPVPDTNISEDESLGNRLALSFIGTESFVPSESELDEARISGIDLLNISSGSQIGNLPIENFYILFDADLSFMTVHRLQTETHALIEQASNHLRVISGQYPNRIAAVNLFRYPADQEDGFLSASSAIGDSLQQLIEIPFYYQSAYSVTESIPSGFNFVSNRIMTGEPLPETQSQVVLFEPGERVSESLQVLQHILNRTLEYEDSIVIIPAEWFFSVIEKQPDLTIIFSAYSEGGAVQFPLPDEKEAFPEFNWSIFLLLLIWGGFLIHYKYQPLFFSVTIRYFFNHTFYVADVMHGRFRTISAGLILMGHHAIITGLFLFTVGDFALSNTGLEVLSAYFPALVISGFERISLFVLGVTTSLLVKIISLLWIYLLNKQIKTFSQAVNLYSWPFAVNLITISLLVYMVLTDVNANLILAVSVLFLLVWFISYNSAAIAGARYLEKRRFLNVLLTVGLHFIIITAIILFVLFTPEITEPLLFALSVP